MTFKGSWCETSYGMAEGYGSCSRTMEVLGFELSTFQAVNQNLNLRATNIQPYPSQRLFYYNLISEPFHILNVNFLHLSDKNVTSAVTLAIHLFSSVRS